MGVTIGLLAAGAAAAAGGAYESGQAGASNKNALRNAQTGWLPNITSNQQNYFADLSKYFPQAQGLSNQMSNAEQQQAFHLRDQAIPGLNSGIQSAAPGIFSLMKGQVPDSIMANFQRAGGASTVGSGFGGSNFGALNTGLFGARGSLGAMQTGFGLLPTLLGAMPQVSAPSAATFLGQGVMNPSQVTNTQMAERQQNIGIEQQLANMKGSQGIFGDFLGTVGGALMGAGMGGGIPGLGGSQSGTPYGNTTPGYLGNQGDAYYYNVPVTYG